MHLLIFAWRPSMMEARSLAACGGRSPLARTTKKSSRLCFLCWTLFGGRPRLRVLCFSSSSSSSGPGTSYGDPPLCRRIAGACHSRSPALSTAVQLPAVDAPRPTSRDSLSNGGEPPVEDLRQREQWRGATRWRSAPAGQMQLGQVALNKYNGWISPETP